MNASRVSTAPHARLRNSCDACNTAKVKCSKEQPSCRRCMRRNVTCVYSLSLRPSRRPQSDPAVTTAMPTSIDAAFDFNAHMQLSLPELDDYFCTDALADFPPLSPTQTQLLPHQQQLSPQTTPQQQHQHQHQHQRQQPIRPIPPMQPMPPTPPTCTCQHMILAKLSALPAAARTHVLPFDRALSENRSIVALCSSTLECTSCTRGDDDVMLLLTLTALLAHVLGVFDAQFRARREALNLRDSDSYGYGSLHMLTPPPTAYTASVGGQATPSGSTDGSEPQPFVRLSLGSYEIDEKDEQILQMNLFKIELGKITALIEAFEGRLSRLGAGRSDPANETKLHQDITVYLKQRLRANAEALKRLARASGCIDM